MNSFITDLRHKLKRKVHVACTNKQHSALFRIDRTSTVRAKSESLLFWLRRQVYTPEEQQVRGLYLP
ncbi:MAG: hypothetical protein ABSB78_05065 [Bacteroidota bacterium]